MQSFEEQEEYANKVALFQSYAMNNVSRFTSLPKAVESRDQIKTLSTLISFNLINLLSCQHSTYVLVSLLIHLLPSGRQRGRRLKGKYGNVEPTSVQ